MIDLLPFKPSDMPQFSEEMVKLHLELYEKYVKLANEMFDMDVFLKGEGNATYSPFSEWHKKYSTVLNAIKLHEEYFRCVGQYSFKEEDPDAEGKAKAEIEDVWGSFNAFQTLFRELVMSTNGWVILGYDVRQVGGNGVLHLDVIEGHDKFAVVNFQPIITIDTWEHAYMLDFKLDKKKYLDACLENLNWQTIHQNFQRTAKLNA